MDCRDSRGLAKISLTKRNEFGILDHYMKTFSGVEDVFVPMRVVQNGN
jgi:hypothetical protein